MQKRKKQPKSENQSTADLRGKKIGEDAFAASKKRESEEQLKRGSRNNTHQKVILVPNFTEEIRRCDAEQEPLEDAPELSLANQRRREEAARRKAWDDRQEQRCLERGKRGSTSRPAAVKKPELQLVDRRV